MNPIERFMAGQISEADALRAESLLLAVRRQMICSINGHVLDVSTAVMVCTTGQNFIMSPEGYASHGAVLAEGIALRGWEITEVINGAELP